MRNLYTASAVIILSGTLWYGTACPQKVQEPAAPAATAEQAAQAEPGDVKAGESLFVQHCKLCHPDGGNIMNTGKTLSLKDREAHNVNSVEAIVHQMRNPGPGMSVFDERTISDEEARKIAEYILVTFK
jgi:cytochrome c6